MEKVEAVVVGAGVVGLAVARRLALAGLEVLVLEREEGIGTGTSSRNSEVIHAGIYYPPGSLKARLCIEGRAFLYRYCAERHVPHRRCGKLIVAGRAQRRRLESIRANAEASGVDDLEWWEAERIREVEPELRADAALWSPSTGILDSHALMLAYQADAEAAGAMFAFRCPLLAARRKGAGFLLDVGGDEPMELACRLLVNAAGLDAPALARRIKAADAASLPRGYLCKGSYFGLSGRSPFRHLVYPVPEQAGLGIHATLDLAGRCRFGPDTEWVEEIDYDVDPSRVRRFAEAIRSYWPGLPEDALYPDYAGIRPKIVPEGAPPADFRIDGPAEHGVPGLVHLFGIESPGLTASAAIAGEVARRLGLAGRTGG